MHRFSSLAVRLPRLLADAWWDAWEDFWSFEWNETTCGIDHADNFYDAGGAPNAEIAGGDF